MPAPKSKAIPKEAGYPGLPIRDEAPEYAKAWEYYNGEVRPRREKDEKGIWRRVEPGKLGGELFPVCTTLPHHLTDFGLGVAMYFGKRGGGTNMKG